MRHKNPATGSTGRRPWPTRSRTSRPRGPNEVTLQAAVAPNADLPVILGTFHFHIVKDGTTDFNAGIGTGPYKVKEFKPGIRARSPCATTHYWRPNRPYLDEIEYVGIGDERRASIALLVRRAGPGRARSNSRSVRSRPGRPQADIFETKAGTLHRPDHAARQRPGQQSRLRRRHEVPVQPRADGQVRSCIGSRRRRERPAHRPRRNRFYRQGLQAAAVSTRDKAKWHLQKRQPRQRGDPGGRRRRRRPTPSRWRWCCSMPRARLGVNLDVQPHAGRTATGRSTG